MKTTIIGCGNMGGAIARGFVTQGVIAPANLTVADPSQAVRDQFTQLSNEITTTDSNTTAIAGAELVIVAVKPWFMEQVLGQIAPHFDPSRQMIASIAAGITFEQMTQWLDSEQATMFRIIPNTAIALGQSTTFIASHQASAGQQAVVEAIFAPLGSVFSISEQEMTSATALSSCGIAYALSYIDAAARGGDQLGIPYPDAQQIVMQTVKGALALLEANDTLPQQEIDRVTTPGGITLRGLEEMERCGFSQAVINGLKASK